MTTSTTTPLSERIIPTRSAAKRASAVFAGQVQNSPGHSEDDPEPSDSFGEPASRRLPNVKYRYNAKGKFRASPLKQTDSPSPSPKRKAKPKPNRKPKPMAPSHSQPSLSSKKRKASAALLDREDTASTLTTLSPSPCPTRPISPDILSKNSPPTSTTPLQRFGTRGDSIRLIGASTSETTSSSKSLSQSSPRRRKADKAKTSGQVNGLHFSDVDTLVWVLVNDFGVAVTAVKHDDDITILENQMWWPARIVQKEPLRVTLFGDMALSREPSTILSPSEYNIMPIHDASGEKRFSRATFRVSSFKTVEFSNPSPRKKAKTDICERWEEAVKAMEGADELKRDGMPEMISAYTGGASSGEDMEELRAASSPSRSGIFRSANPKAKVHGKHKGIANATLRDEFEVPTGRAWSPPPPDPTLQLPGELVLAQAPRTRGNKYWPAQLISYVSPTKPGGKQRYRVKFLDDQEYDLTRDKFWTSEEEGFITCEMGEFESAVQDVEAPDSENEQDESENKERSPSPQLADPPPAVDDFEDLPMRGQLAYVRPVLKAILQGKYAPASKKHEAFMRGGVARSSLMKRAAVRGGLDPSEVKQMQRLISRWALGEGYARRDNRGLEPLPEVVPPPKRETAPVMDGDGLVEADVQGAHTIPPSDLGRDALSQSIPPSDNSSNQVDESFAMAVDAPDLSDDSSEPKTNKQPSAPLQGSENCTIAPTVDSDCLTAGKVNGVSATPDSAGSDIMSQPIPLSDIRNQVDDGSLEANQKADELLHENTRSAINLAADNIGNIDSGKADEILGDDGKPQPIPVSDIRNVVDDGDAMVVDKPAQPMINELPSASLYDQLLTPLTEQLDFCDDPDSPHVREVTSRIPQCEQQRLESSQEYESLPTLDKLDYCMNILLPEAIQQLLLWRSGERTSAALLSPEEEERLHERGETKAQETDWVYDLLHLREAQARLWGVDLKAKGKEKDISGDVKGGGTRSRPRRATILR